MDQATHRAAFKSSTIFPFLTLGPPEVHNWIVRYAVALAAVGSALLVSVLFRDVFERSPFLLFWPAVFVSTWFGNLGPGLLASVLTAVLVNLFFQRPAGEEALSAVSLLPLGIFLLLTGGVSWLHLRRRQLESMVHAQAAWFRATVHSIGDGVIVTDAQGRVVLINLVASALTGWPERDALGQQLLTIFPIVNEQTRQPVENPALRVLATGVITGLANHTILIARDGTERPIDDSGAPIRDASGQIAGAVLVFRDISERRNQEKALRESEERFRLAAEALSGVIYDVDLRTGQALRSTGIEALTGYTIDEIPPLASWWDGIVHPDDCANAIEVLQDNVAGRSPTRAVEYRIRHRDGRVLWVWDKARLLYDDAGTLVRLVGTTMSIDDRRRLEESVARSEAQVRAQLAEIEALYEGAPVGLAALDRDLRYLRVNDMLAEINGVPAENHIGRTIPEVLPGVTEELEALFRRVIETGEPLLNFEFTTETAARPGVERTFLEHWTPIWGEDERPAGVNVVVEEITERKRLEQEAQEAAAGRERARLARDLHDAVSQTLFSASMIAEALPRQMEVHPEKVPGLVEQLRTLTRGAQAEMRTLLLELRPAALHDADLKSLLGLLADATRSRKAFELTVTADDCMLPLDVKVGLYRIAQEALNNVVKHSHATQVSVQLERNTGGVALAVADNGRGFSVDEVEATSLGLKIMRERAAAISAGLALSSEQGAGTQIRVIWPQPAVGNSPL